MASIRKYLALSAVDNYLGMALQIASTVVLARILTPQETGVYAVGAVFASLASNFRDFGVSEFLVQERELNRAILRAALTVNIAVSWGMGLLVFVAAPFVADFYREPGVRDVMRVLACNFLLIPFGAVTMACFRRDMNYEPIVTVNIAANIASFLIVVTLSLHGFGYMSLAWSSLGGIVVTLLVVTLLRPAGFPVWPGLRGVGRIFHFGKFASSMYVLGQAGRGAPEMIIGRAQDMAAVGIFSRAYGIVELFNRLVLRSMNSVYLPYFARCTQEDGTPRRGLLIAVSFLTAVGWPFLALMGVLAYSAVHIIYGPQWLVAVPLAQVLCLVGAVEIMYYPAKEAMLAQGKANKANNLQFIIQTLRVLGLLAAVPFGLPGACWGLAAAAVAGAVASHRYLTRFSGWSGHDLWQAVRSSLILTAMVVGPTYLLTLVAPIGEHNYVLMGLAGGATGTALWLVGLHRLDHPLWTEIMRALTPVLLRLRRRSRL